MKTGDLITSYLSNEMTPEQERQFLLSVAASDSLRLALKSHVMLDRIVTRQTQSVNVPNAIRENIFAQMSASMGPASGAASLPKSPGLFARFSRGAMMALLTVSGFAAGYFIHPQPAPVAPSQAGQQPAVRHLDGGGLPSESPAPTQSVSPQAPATGSAEPTMASSQQATVQRSASQPVQRVRTAGIARSRSSVVSSAPASQVPVNAAVSTPDQGKPTAPTQNNPLDPPHTSSVSSGPAANEKPVDGSNGSSKVDFSGSVKRSDGSPQKILKQEDPK